WVAVGGFCLSVLSGGLAHAEEAGVGLRLSSAASYPFTCYNGLVEADAGSQIIHGQLTKVYYGYTRANREEFKANPSLAWFNSQGEATAQGVVDVFYQHNGLYKGAMVLSEVIVPAPPMGMNLVFRVGYLQRVSGSCYNSSEPLQTSYAESGVFFVEN
ncbi:MAG: hypothetical protein KGQ59_12725, partial [Bdellovibrionales bacterium]|nr:hypothetical protein [Bdellovibrionales bacterium]